MRRYTRVFAFIAMLVLAVASMAVNAAGPMTMTIANQADVVKMDPAYTTDTPTSNVTNQIFDRLVQRDNKGIVIPGLASSWTVSKDMLVWTFHLRKDVVFHDGTPFNARAVKFTFDRLKDPAMASPGAKDVKGIKEVVVKDDYTVEFVLASPNVAFLDMIIMSQRCAIVSPAAVQKWGKDFTSHPVGTGPFKFSEWVPDTRVVLVRNEKYWQGAPKLDRLVFRPIPDAATQLVELETGGVDMILKVLPTDLAKVKANRNLRLFSVPDFAALYVFMNCQKAPFDDVNVRRAINTAIPVSKILQAFLRDSAVALDSALPKASWAYTRPRTQYPYNRAKAADMMKKAGWVDTDKDGILEKNGKKFEVTLYTPDGRYQMDKEIAGVVQEELKKIGIKVNIKVLEWGAYLDAVDAGEHDLCILGWSQSHPEPTYFLNYQFKKHPDGWANDAFYEDNEATALLNKGETTVDREQRKAIYAEFLEHVAKDAPFVPLYSANLTFAARTWVKGYVHNVGNFNLFKVTIQK